MDGRWRACRGEEYNMGLRSDKREALSFRNGSSLLLLTILLTSFYRMNLRNTILENYSDFSEPLISNRFVKHDHVVKFINDLPALFKSEVAGYSVEGRAIHLIRCGHGPTKVFLWSQMHGDEATGTMALFDLLNFLAHPGFTEAAEALMSACSLYFMPMVNPDGAERFSRRNAQQIDLNRDYLQLCTEEAKILKETRDRLRPEFGFNLHDQSTLWSVQGTGKPATLSYLAPAYNAALDIDDTRANAMLVIADIFMALNPVLPGQIGLFDDAHEPRAFGDNFQKNGTSTILIEAGGLHGDPEKQEIRKYYFLSLFAGLQSIASKTYREQAVAHYFRIPRNSKEIFHMLIHNVLLPHFRSSIGLNFEEEPNVEGLGTDHTYVIEDIGDLSFSGAYAVYDAGELQLRGDVIMAQAADFDLLQGDQVILSFKNGKLLSKL
jgi:hypothetical protein